MEHQSTLHGNYFMILEFRTVITVLKIYLRNNSTQETLEFTIENEIKFLMIRIVVCVSMYSAPDGPVFFCFSSTQLDNVGSETQKIIPFMK